MRPIPGVVNAAVGFDEATLQPTYELKVGVPGRVGGDQHCEEAGTESAIIEAARGRLGTQARDVASFRSPACRAAHG